MFLHFEIIAQHEKSNTVGQWYCKGGQRCENITSRSLPFFPMLICLLRNMRLEERCRITILHRGVGMICAVKDESWWWRGNSNALIFLITWQVSPWLHFIVTIWAWDMTLKLSTCCDYGIRKFSQINVANLFLSTKNQTSAIPIHKAVFRDT